VGGSLAHADASAELPAVAVATEAEMVVRSRSAERVVRAQDFFAGHFTTELADDECLVEVRFPASPAGAGWSFQEVARRHGDFALVGVAAMVNLAGDDVDSARICLMGVADRPVRAVEVEQQLAGAKASPDAFAAAATDAVKGLEPPGDIHGSSAYRRHIAGVAVRRALVAAAARARGDRP
jgi:carbon-monoxide dehydrogenase medium subunit